MGTFLKNERSCWEKNTLWTKLPKNCPWQFIIRLFVDCLSLSFVLVFFTRDFFVLAAEGVLPILAFKDKILDHVKNHRITCIQGETGCGKSTKVPQFILEDYGR